VPTRYHCLSRRLISAWLFALTLSQIPAELTSVFMSAVICVKSGRVCYRNRPCMPPWWIPEVDDGCHVYSTVFCKHQTDTLIATYFETRTVTEQRSFQQNYRARREGHSPSVVACAPTGSQIFRLCSQRPYSRDCPFPRTLNPSTPGSGDRGNGEPPENRFLPLKKSSCSWFLQTSWVKFKLKKSKPRTVSCCLFFACPAACFLRAIYIYSYIYVYKHICMPMCMYSGGTRTKAHLQSVIYIHADIYMDIYIHIWICLRI